MFDDNEILSYLESKFEFQLQEKLGQGSFGTVYRAIDNTDGQECAIKILYKQNMANSVLEGKLLQQLDHPHIVKFKRIGETKSKFVIIMELMKGGTMAQLIKQRKQNKQPFTDEEQSTIMKCILSAVDYMHSQNILHRDLKPENILLCDSNNLNSVKVADFGLGIQYSNEMTYRSFLQQCGTVFYMSPEQLKEQPYSKPIDLWSCGIIMYMIISMGKHPFNYNNEIENKEQYIKLISSNPKIEIWPDCTNLAYDLITRLTNFSPSNRYNAGKALNHPWITRRLDDMIPLSFEENRQIFQAKNSFMNVIKMLVVLKFFKNKASKKQLKRVSTRKNYSSSQFLIKTETIEAQSPLIYNASQSRINQDSLNMILSLNQNKQLEVEEEMSNSPLLKQRDSFSLVQNYNSPQRKKEFMIKSIGGIPSSSSPQSKVSKNQNKQQQLITPSFFKPPSHTHSNSLSHNKQHNNSTGLNNSKQFNPAQFSLNSSGNDILRKTQNLEVKNSQKTNLGLKEQKTIRAPSNNSSSSRQEYFQPISLRISDYNPQSQYLNYNNNYTPLNTQALNFIQKQQTVPHSISPNSSYSQNQNQAQLPPQAPSYKRNAQNPSSTFYNKQRQIRQRPSDTNFSQKDFDEIKDITRRIGTAEQKFSSKRKSGSLFQINTANNNSLNSNNTPLNRNLINEQQKSINNNPVNNSNNSQLPMKQIRKLSDQFTKSGIKQSINLDNLQISNMEDLPLPKIPLKSSRNISTFYENSKNNNE